MSKPLPPFISVNLQDCSCGAVALNAARRAGNPSPVDDLACQEDCRGLPLLIPCPLPFIAFKVGLGECQCRRFLNTHLKGCPAHPVTVACSVKGKDWASLEVDDAWVIRDGGVVDDKDDPVAMRVARERWAVLHALLQGKHGLYFPNHLHPRPTELVVQRDKVFNWLAGMVRHDLSAEQAQRQVDEAFPYEQHQQPGDGDHRASRPSAGRFAAYVRHLLVAVCAE